MDPPFCNFGQTILSSSHNDNNIACVTELWRLILVVTIHFVRNIKLTVNLGVSCYPVVLVLLDIPQHFVAMYFMIFAPSYAALVIVMYTSSWLQEQDLTKCFCEPPSLLGCVICVAFSQWLFSKWINICSIIPKMLPVFILTPGIAKAYRLETVISLWHCCICRKFYGI